MATTGIRRIYRAVLLGCLLLTQFQLLWIAAIHWNEELVPSIASAKLVRDGRGQTSQSPHEKNPCAVCQIVRQNAMRPGIGAPAAQPPSAVAYQAPLTSRGFHSFDRNVSNGRAPPRS
ncbi:MAG: hypothetical protein ACM3NO_00675 [Deltaproteobacteria bacterium]